MSKSILEYLQENFRLSLTAFYFFIPTSILSVPAIFWAEELPVSIIELFAVGIVITGLTFGIYWTLVFISRQFAKINVLLIGFTVLILTGVIRGLIMFTIFHQLGYQNPTTLLERTINSTFNVFVWLGLGSIVIESNRKFTRRYQALMTQILILKLRKSSESEAGYSYIAQQILQMQKRIQGAVANLPNSASNSNPEQVLAKTLRKELEEELRPLSQRLLIKSIYDPPSLRLKSVLGTSIVELKFNYLLIASIYAGSFILNVVFLVDPFLAILNGLLHFFVFLSVNYLRNYLTLKFLRAKEIINTLFLCLVGLVVGLACTFIIDLMGLDHSYLAAVIIAPILSILIIATSFLQLASTDRKQMLEILASKSKSQESDFVSRANRGNAASYIHNSLQSELVSLVHQLDAVDRNPDATRSKLVMERVESFVSRSRSEDFKNFLETPQLRLKRVSESWEGIVYLQLNIEPEIFEDPARSSLVVQLIEEAIANAVRSGQANVIDVHVEFVGESIKLTVRDNGKSLIADAKKGFGSKWLDSVAVSDWTLEDTGSGCLLTVEI